MIEQIVTTIDILNDKIRKLEEVYEENKAYLEEVSANRKTPQSEVDDRMSLAREYNRMLQIAKIEKEYFESIYIGKSQVKYDNVPSEVISFLIIFLNKLKLKATGFKLGIFLNEAITSLNSHPAVPERNIIISFELDNTSYSIIYTDYKIELSQWVSDAQDYSNDSYQAFLFQYELEGYTDTIGNFSEFRYALNSALKEIKVTDINVSEEE